MKKVAEYLKISHRPDTPLLTVNEIQHPGTCEWLTEHPVFHEWMEDTSGDRESLNYTPELGEYVKSNSQQPPILWLHGRPGTGKSVAMGHVVRYLQSRNHSCSFHFFRHEDESSTELPTLPRSLAFQMAEADSRIRRLIIEEIDEEIRLDVDDYRSLWEILFKKRIFKANHARPQYWIIDAVDECQIKYSKALLLIMSGIRSELRVHILMSSRPGVIDFPTSTDPDFHTFEIAAGEESSLQDIQKFLEAKCADSSNIASHEGLAADMRDRSNGIFLWASLTMAKMQDAYTVEDKHEMLLQAPPGMDKLYDRIVDSVRVSPSCARAKCILTWVICSRAPLHLDEVKEAVKLDIGRTLKASANQLETITGHMVIVDQQSRVRMAHQTTTSFLTAYRGDHDFWIDRSTAHSRVAEVCLDICCGPDFAPPRMRRYGSSVKRATNGNSPLATYAAANFSSHLVRGAAGGAHMSLLSNFVQLNAPRWVERIASMGDLAPFQLLAKRIRIYLAHRPFMSVEAPLVSEWTKEISHIITAFHAPLLASPRSIHVMIPRLCPPNSTTWRLFATSSKKFRIEGPLVERDWGDRLACHSLPEDASAVACGGRLLAVGLRNGDIKLYGQSGHSTPGVLGTLWSTLKHGKSILKLAFSPTSDTLASVSARQLLIWNVQRRVADAGTYLWSARLDFTPSSVDYRPVDDTVTLTNPEQNSIITFGCNSGRQLNSTLLHLPTDTDSNRDVSSNFTS